MSAMRAVPVVGDGPNIGSDIEGFLWSDALIALVRAFDGDRRMFNGSIRSQLAALDSFSDRWDSRGGNERDRAKLLSLSPDQVVVVRAAADAFGMTESRPPRHVKYDHVFALGGLVRACLVRPAYAGRLIRSGAVVSGAVTALGGHRRFSDGELHLAVQLGLAGIDEEFEALAEGTKRAFDVGVPTSIDGYESKLIGGSWSVQRYHSPEVTTIQVAAAPSTDPDVRRANTADTYRWFAETLASAEPGNRFLAVTNPIYVPAQQAAAVRMLHIPFGISVETIGADGHELPRSFQQTFGPSHYLQEIRSTIRAYLDLSDAIEI